MWKNEIRAMFITGERTCCRAWMTLTRNASIALRLKDRSHSLHDTINLHIEPDVVAEDARDEHFALVIVHEQTANHGGDFLFLANR